MSEPVRLMAWRNASTILGGGRMPKSTTVAKAAATNDVKKALVALRDRLAVAIDDASENMLPQIAGQYRNVLSDIADLEAAERGPARGVTPSHAKFGQRRQNRQSAAKVVSISDRQSG